MPVASVERPEISSLMSANSTTIPGLQPGLKPVGVTTPTEVYSRQARTSPIPPEQLVPWLARLFTRLSSEDRELDWRRHQKWLVNSKMYEGEHFGRVSQLDGKWRPVTRGKGDPRYVHNKFRYYSDAITTQWVQSRTDLLVVPIPAHEADDHAVGAARKAQEILDYYEKTILTEVFLQEEGKLGQFTGQMFRYTYWDATAGPKAKRPQFGSTSPTKLAGDSYTCADCGQSGPSTEIDDDKCPECGSQSLDQQTVPELGLSPVDGYEDQSVGDIVTRIVPAYQVKYDRTVRKLEDSAYLRLRFRVRTEVAEALVPWVNTLASSDESEDPALRAERILARGVGNTRQSGSSQSAGGQSASEPAMTVVDQWWLRPAMYAKAEVAMDVKLHGGQIITKGPLSESFPTGMYVLVMNGEPVDFRDECFLDHWQHTPFVLIPTRVDGDGVEDMVEPQREYNDIKGLVLSNIKHVDGAGLMYRPEYIKNKDFSGKPYEMTPVQNLPPDVPLSAVVSPIPRVSLPAEVFNYLEQEDQEMQIASKGFSAATGAPDINAAGGDTATGQRLMSSNARSMRAPELALRAAGNIKWAEQVLRLFKENATDARYIPLAGKTGEKEGSWFKASDIDADFYITAKPGSWQPTGPMDKQANLSSALQVLGGVEGLLAVAQQAPKLLAEVCEIYDVDLDVGDDTLDARLARLRLDQMRAVVPQAQAAVQSIPPEVLQQAAMQAQAAGQPPPPSPAAQMIFSAAPPDPEDPHAQLERYYVRWLITDEGLDATPEMREAVHMAIDAARQGGVAQAQQQGQAQLAAQAPQMQAQQAMAAQQSQQQSQGDAARQQAQQAADQQSQQAQAIQQQTQQQGELQQSAIEQAGQLQQQSMANDADARQQDAELQRAAMEGQAQQAQLSDSSAQRQHEQDTQTRQHAHELELAKLAAATAKSKVKSPSKDK